MRNPCAALVAAFSMFAVMFGAANASLIGVTSNTTNGFFPIDFRFGNSSSVHITQLIIDGSTANAGGITWDSIGTIGGSAVLAGPASGVDTEVVTFDFSSFGFGDRFRLSQLDPDFTNGPQSVLLTDLIGVMVSAVFSDGTRYKGIFVDHPSHRGDKLILSEVPLPGALVLFLTGIGGMVFARRKQKVA